MKRTCYARSLAVIGWTYGMLVIVFLFIPAVVVLPSSLSDSEILDFPPSGLTMRWFSAVFVDDTWLDSARTSLIVATSSALISCCLGLMVALAQYRNVRLSSSLKTLLTLPITVPSIIIGTGAFGLLILMPGALGSLWPLVIVDAALSLPVTLTVMLPSFGTIDPLIWTAANSLGARPYQIVLRILLPNVGVAIIISAILAFHTAWEETTVALFIGPSVMPPLSSRLYSYLQQNVTPEIAAVATLLLALNAVGAILILLLGKIAKRHGRPPQRDSLTPDAGRQA